MTEIPYPFKADPRKIDVWCMRIGKTCKNSCLSREELARASRFRSERTRNAFVATRSILRVLLGEYLNVTPESVVFQYGQSGKPELCTPTCLAFNVSHSADVALVAVGMNCDIGVDVEKIIPLPDICDIAKDFFCPQELADIMSVAYKEQEGAFFRCWTRKEAYMKAVGQGLQLPLDSFCVTVLPGMPARLRVFNADRFGRQWHLEDIYLGGKYAAAIAYDGERRSINVRPISGMDTAFCDVI